MSSNANPDSAGLSPLKRAYLAIERLQGRVESLEGAGREPIAVVGLGCRFPGAPDPAAFWDLLRDGGDAVREVPPDRWDADALYDPDPGAPGRMSTRWGGFLDRVDTFDPGFFGIAPREAARMDPQQRLLLEVAWEALEHAGIPARGLEGSQTGVFLGVSTNDYALLQAHRNHPADLDPHYASGIANSVVSGRLSYLLGLTGPSITLDTACSSSLVAVHLACQSLRAGESSLGLAGGVNVITLPDNTIAFSSSSMMAPDGRCKAFDARADGFVRSEGCGVVVLKRLGSARADGDRVLAVIRGEGVNQDGASSGLTAPNGPSQEAVVRHALERAGISPADVSYVEAHGTGTSLGDPIEVQALGNVLAEGRAPDDRLLIGSVKSNVGHCEAAAGVAGLIKVVLALRHGEIPPSLHFSEPNRHIPWERYPFLRVVTERTPWREPGRVAGVSSFGFSGTNAHLVLEAAPTEAPDEVGVEGDGPERAVRVLPLSARTPDALRELAGRWVPVLEDAPAGLGDLCFTAGAGRSHFEHRLTVAAPSAAEARERLAAHLAGEPTSAVASGTVGRGDPPRVAFLFTGQGAQHAGMGRRLYETRPTFRRAMNRCAEILEPRLERPLLEVIYGEGDGSALNRTRYTQPALFALQYALTRLWRAWGVEPAVVLGHSVGEYAAACAAGVFGLEDGLELIAERGRLMESVPGSGGMASVDAPAGAVAEILEPWAGAVTVACVNAPRNTVISGESRRLEEAVDALEAAGLRCKRLVVSHGFHSSQMDPVLDAFRTAAERVSYSEPEIGIVSNVTGAPAGAGEMCEADYWVRHVRSAVLFRQGVEALVEGGADLFVEIGPHGTLCALGQECVDVPPEAWTPTLRRDREDADQVADAVSRLYVAGVDVDWRGFHADERRRVVDVPTYPFQRTRHWLEPVEVGGVASWTPGLGEGTARGPSGAAEVHPLLGREIRSPRVSETIYEATYGPGSIPWLRDHRVFGTPILPGAAFAEIVLAVARRLLPDGTVAVRDLEILQPLPFPDGERARVQVVAAPDGPDAWSVEVLRYAGGAAAASASWVTHATARLGREDADGAASARDPRPPAELDARPGGEIDVAELYEAIEGRGVELGPAFRGLESISRSGDETVARVRLAEALAGPPSGYVVHPSLLDGAFQAVAALVIGEGEGARDDAFLPTGVDRLVLHRSPGVELESRAILREGDPGVSDALVADLRLHDAEGRPVATFEGFRLRRATAATAAWALRDRISGWQYAVEWRRRPLPAGEDGPGTEAGSIPIAGVARDVADESEALAARHGLRSHGEALAEIDEVVSAVVVRALDRLGWAGSPGERVRPDELAEAVGVAPEHRRLLGRLLRFLEERGVLTGAGGDGYRVARRPATDDLDDRITELRERRPEAEAELTLLARSASRLDECLSGHADPLEILFPEGGFAAADDLYRRSPPALVFNGLMRRAVEELVERWPRGREIRVLEIGAGTGGTTSFVLPALPRDRTTYVYTDVSPLFVRRAKERFAEYSFVEYGVLDIEEDPTATSMPTGSFDLVVAANVVHATSELMRTVGHVRSYLAPGGVLLLLEGTRPRSWIDVTFGLTEGWWAFRDAGLRPDYPLVDRARWERLLDDAGFTEVAAIPDAGADPGLTDNAVVLARRPVVGEGRAGAAAASPSASVAAGNGRRWSADGGAEGATVVFSDGAGGTGRRLVRGLRARGATVIEVVVGDGFSRIGDDRFAVDPARPDDYRALLDVLGSRSEAPRTVVHLWALREERHPPSTTGELAAAQDVGARSALHLVQALVGLSGSAPRVYVATRRARSVRATDVDPSQAPLWGLARVIELEHPELGVTMVDLEGEIPFRDGDALLREIASGDREPLVAYRRGERFVARLRPAPLEEPRVERDAEVRNLECRRPGVIESLELVPVEVPPPGPGEVQLRVRATGLNFRDVLIVLGMYPEPDAPVGGECAGEIVATGPDVDRFAVGDRVMAMAPGAFGTRVNARSALVAPVPPGLSLAGAATVPSAFVTASHALRRLARLEGGESVLIHAAAGGVGQAAVQLARAAGAEIIGTAGSDEKRAHLREQGIRHVFDSRSLAFVDGVREVTGGEGVDVVLNSLADEFAEASFELVAPDGRFVELGKRGVLSPEDAAARRPDVSYHLVDLAEAAERDPEHVGELLRSVARDLESGAIRPLAAQLFEREEAVDAFRFMAQARHIGKIVVAERLDRVGAGRYAERGLRPDATYLVTGGTGGLGLEVARWLALGGARHLALLGRGAPGEAARSVVGELRERGVEVELLRADVAEVGELERALATLRNEMPPLAGVIHGAGILRDGVLTNQTWHRFSEVLAPKVLGGWNLHRVTRDAELDFFVLFSSISSVLGSPGQGNHAAANAFLDALAEARRGAGLPAQSLQWGVWAEVGSAAEHGVGERVAARGIGSMTPAEGVAALGLFMRDDRPVGAVTPVDWSRFLPDVGERTRDTFYEELSPDAESGGSGAPAAAAFRERIARMPEAKRVPALGEWIREQARGVLGLDSIEAVPRDRAMQELGLDSLMAVELRNIVRTGLELETSLPSTLVFDYPTVELLARHLADDVLGWTDAGEGDGPDGADSDGGGEPRDDLAASLGRLEALSDEQVSEELRDHMAEDS